MRLLTWLTIGYAAILVAALAVVLILILVRLRQVHAALRPAAAALETVSERTVPLHTVVTDVAEGVMIVQGELRRTAEAIIRAGEPFGISPPESPTAQAGATARWAGGGPE